LFVHRSKLSGIVWKFLPASRFLSIPALLFFLTVGDVLLTGQWRTLASIQAANGVIIFGWTTALIFYFIQHIYKEE